MQVSQGSPSGVSATRFLKEPGRDTYWQLPSSLLRLPTLGFGADLEKRLTQGVTSISRAIRKDEIDVAWPLGLDDVVLAQPRQSEDASSEISELVFSNTSLNQIPY
jgi:hypothetical protein